MVKKNFEDAMKRLEEIVKNLEEGDLSLDSSLKFFEEGMDLMKFCSEKLEEAEHKVTQLIKENDGKYAHRPFEIKEEDETP